MLTLHAFGRVHPVVHGETRDLRVQWALEETGLTVVPGRLAGAVDRPGPGGVVYEIQADTTRARLVRMANDAIRRGPR